MARRRPVARVVPRRSPAGKLLVFAWERVGSLWRWRELTIPLALLYLAWAVGGDAAAVSAAVLLAGAAAFALAVRPAAVLGAPTRCLERSRAFKRQRRWPRVCVGLRWFRKLDAGALLVPVLLSWEEEPGLVRVALLPLPEQHAGSWDPMADAFRRFLGGASVEWRESFGTLRIVVSRVGLPEFLRWCAHGASEGRLVIGRRHGGRLLTIDARTTPHVLLSGTTGSGKGGAIRVTAAAALQGGWHLVVLDPKESGEYAWLEPLGVPVVTRLREQVETLEHLAAVRRGRQEIVRRYGADTWLDLELLQSWRPVLVVVDEAADILAATKGKSGEDRLRASLQHKAGELIAELARKGRSAGIHLLLAIQRPETTQLGDQGGSLRKTSRRASRSEAWMRMGSACSGSRPAIQSRSRSTAPQGGASASGSQATRGRAFVRWLGLTRSEPEWKSRPLTSRASS